MHFEVKKMARISVKTKSVPIVVGDGWLVRLEKAAFGWEYMGRHSELEEWDQPYEKSDTSYETYGDVIVETKTIEKGTRRESRLTKYHDFGRVSPYSYNAIFHLFEFLSGIFSAIRRFVVLLAGVVVSFFAVMSGILFLLKDSGWQDGLNALGAILLLYLLVVVLPSLLIAGIGYLLRRLLKIDTKVCALLEKNNYYPNWRERFK